MTGAFRVIAACLALSLTPLANAGDADGRPLPAESVYQVDAVLTRAGDGPVAWRSLRGVPRVVTMFYSSCRAVCPMIVESARAVQRGLPEPAAALKTFWVPPRLALINSASSRAATNPAT